MYAKIFSHTRCHEPWAFGPYASPINPINGKKISATRHAIQLILGIAAPYTFLSPKKSTVCCVNGLLQIALKFLARFQRLALIGDPNSLSRKLNGAVFLQFICSYSAPDRADPCFERRGNRILFTLPLSLSCRTRDHPQVFSRGMFAHHRTEFSLALGLHSSPRTRAAAARNVGRGRTAQVLPPTAPSATHYVASTTAPSADRDLPSLYSARQAFAKPFCATRTHFSRMQEHNS